MKEQLPTSNDNIQERRFTLATESSARTRLDGFRDGVKSFQKEHPEFLGATVYGSMIKGDQAKETSDVDAFLYIDADIISDTDKNKKSEDLESEYRTSFLKSLNIPVEEASKYYGDLRAKVLSGQVLEDNINGRIEYENQYNTYKKMLEEKYTYETPEEEKEKLLAQEPKTQPIDFAVLGMFHARVGSGIEKYRHLFLEKIMALPDKKMAEKIWDDVYFDLKTYEQRKDPNKVIELPVTLEEATKVYHPDLYKSENKRKDEEKISDLRNKILQSL